MCNPDEETEKDTKGGDAEGHGLQVMSASVCFEVFCCLSSVQRLQKGQQGQTDGYLFRLLNVCQMQSVMDLLVCLLPGPWWEDKECALLWLRLSVCSALLYHLSRIWGLAVAPGLGGSRLVWLCGWTGSIVSWAGAGALCGSPSHRDLCF